MLASLDESGCLDGVPFMPEMLDLFGISATVTADLSRACDTAHPVSLRRIPEAVILDDLRCNGTAHGGCQAQCRLFWKEAWLRPSSPAGSTREASEDPAYAALERIAWANTGNGSTDAARATYRCQHTQLPAAGEPVRWWSPGSFLHQVTSGNVGLVRFVRVMTRAVLAEVGRRLHVHRRFPFMPVNPPDHIFDTPPPCGLAIGQLVRVRSKEEIARTLNQMSKHQGLWFDREMLAYCGTLARVRAKVERFVNEKNGKLVELSSDCYILEGCTCQGDVSDGRWFCPRAIFAWWRECWLEPVELTQLPPPIPLREGAALARNG